MRGYGYLVLTTFLGITASLSPLACQGVQRNIESRGEYRQVREYDFSCYEEFKDYNEGPFFDNLPCDRDIFPNENKEWFEHIVR